MLPVDVAGKQCLHGWSIAGEQHGGEQAEPVGAEGWRAHGVEHGVGIAALEFGVEFGG